MIVPSFFTDVGCCSQRWMGSWAPTFPWELNPGARASMRLLARTPCCDGQTNQLHAQYKAVN